MDYVGATYVLLQTCFALFYFTQTAGSNKGFFNRPLMNLYYANNLPRFAYYTYTVKKRLAIFSSQAGMSLTKHFWLHGR
jgi:hypothetical protein